MNRKFTFLMIFFFMHIGAMDLATKNLGFLLFNYTDLRGSIFNYTDIESKNNLLLTSKIFTENYNNFIKNFTLHDYIDGLYLFHSHEKKFSAWVNQENAYEKSKWFWSLENGQAVKLIKKLKMYRNSLINYRIYQYNRENPFVQQIYKDTHVQQRQEIKTDKTIWCISQVIKEDTRERLKFRIPFKDTRIAIDLFSQDYTEEHYKQVLNDICSFFGRESDLKNFKAIEDDFSQAQCSIDEIIINKALRENNFSVLVFLVYKLYKLRHEFLFGGMELFLDAATDNNKRLLIQAGYDVRPLIKLLERAAHNNNMESVKSLLKIILESGNLYHSYLCNSNVCQYVFKFELYDLIPKLFEESYFLPAYSELSLTSDQIRIIIETCYNHYGKNLWKDKKAQHFLYLALCSVTYDQKLFDYLSSIMDTLPFPDYHRRLLEDVKHDKDNESFGKKMEFLFSRGVDIAFFQFPVGSSSYWVKVKDYCNSDLYRIMCNVPEKIIIKLIQEKKCVDQVIDVGFIEDLFRYAVIAQKWSIVNYLLPDVIFKHIKDMTYYDAQNNCIRFLNQLIKYCPDQMLVCLKKYMQGDDRFFMTDHNYFIAKILSSAIDAQRLDIVKFLLLHNEVCLLSGHSRGFRISNFLMDNAFTEVIQNCKKWKNIASLLSCTELCYVNKIVVNLQQDQLINIEQIFQWYEQGKFSSQRCEELINIVLNDQGLDDEKAKKILLDVIDKREFLFLEWLLKRKEINIVRLLPKDKMDEVFTYCRKGVIRHIKQTSFTYDERKEFLYRVGIRKVVDLIFHGWWDSLSDLKKIFISGGLMVTLASFIVGLCYKFKYVNSII